MEEKERVYAEFENRLSKNRETIEQLKSKVEQQIKEPGQMTPSLEAIHARQSEAEKKLEKLSRSDGDGWHRHKNELYDFLEDIDTKLRDALAYFH